MKVLCVLQLAGLKALVQFSAIQRIKCSQSVIQKHFTDLLAGKTACLLCVCKCFMVFINSA